MSAMDRHRVENARRLMKLLDRDPLHAEQVRFIALRLFDGLKKLHGLGEEYRDCLEAASLLHDIGYSRGSAGHHKHSALLIVDRGIDGFNRRELRIVAFTARYHRKGGPKKSHADFAALPRADRTVIGKLSAMLQIADGLDRSHRSVIRDLTASINKSSVHLDLIASTPVDVEIGGMAKKSGLFEEVFGKTILTGVSGLP